MQILLLAQAAHVLKLGNISLDGSKIHADASKSHAVSYKHLLELEIRLRQEVSELLTLGERADQGELPLPDNLLIPDEVALRQERLLNLAPAKAVLEARAKERDAAEQADYEATHRPTPARGGGHGQVREREEKARASGRKPGGRPPTPPTAGPQDTDQYNFTDSDSRIMKNSSNAGFDQHYNVQAVVDHASLLIVATALSNHPNDKREAESARATLPSELGVPPAATLDKGYWSPATFQALDARGIEAYIATGREPHHTSWQAFCPCPRPKAGAGRCVAQAPVPPPDDASPKVKMAYKLKTEIGQAIYRLRKCTVEPVIGIIKEVLGFRQFSLRGLPAAAGEWCLVCLAFNLKRLHVLCAN